MEACGAASDSRDTRLAMPIRRDQAAALGCSSVTRRDADGGPPLLFRSPTEPGTGCAIERAGPEFYRPPAAEARKYAAHKVWVRSDSEQQCSVLKTPVRIVTPKSIEGVVEAIVARLGSNANSRRIHRQLSSKTDPHIALIRHPAQASESSDLGM